MRRVFPFLVVVCVVVCAGCGMDRKTQLQQTARDWCLTITASQVMPVYPLTEDLQPGDVFLVQMSVEEQREHFDDTGFLPLDQLVTRLTPDGYADFYRDMFVVPHGATSVDFTRSFQRTADGKNNWTAAPAAAFPTYGFSVSSSEGLNVGIPLYGVPVAMSLLNANAATGSVSIRDAHTIGLDIVPLSEQLGEWANDNKPYLRHYARDLDAHFWQRQKHSFLRIVSRIYVTGGVDIAVSDSKSGSASGDVGQPRPVDLLQPTTAPSLDQLNATQVENAQAAINAKNAGLAETLTPSGGTASTDGGTPTDADTKAKLDAINEARNARQADVDAATTEVATRKTAAADATKAVKESNEKLKAAKESARKVRNDPAADAAKRAAAAKTVEDAKAEVAAKKADPTIAAFKKSVGKLDVAQQALDQVGAMIPGGSLRITAASSRMVTMRQDFTPPLIIGYLAFDREILYSKETGIFLGPPVATQQQILSRRAAESDGPAAALIFQANNTARALELRDAVEKSYSKLSDAQQVARVEELNQVRRKLYPHSDPVIGFPVWLEAASITELKTVMKKANIEIPAAE